MNAPVSGVCVSIVPRQRQNAAWQNIAEMKGVRVFVGPVFLCLAKNEIGQMDGNMVPTTLACSCSRSL